MGAAAISLVAIALVADALSMSSRVGAVVVNLLVVAAIGRAWVAARAPGMTPRFREAGARRAGSWTRPRGSAVVSWAGRMS
jgi:hypothetical protein